MARDRKTMTDSLTDAGWPVDELWLAQTLSEAEGALDELRDQEGWDEPTL